MNRISLIVKRIKNNLLLIAIFISSLIGVILGFAILSSGLELNKFQIAYFKSPGEFFLRALKFIIPPLVQSSLIVSIASSKNNDKFAKTGRIARQTLFLFVLTSVLSAVIASILVYCIRPGRLDRNETAFVVSHPIQAPVKNKLSTVDTVLDMLRNLVPDGMIEMYFQMYRSKVGVHYKIENSSNSSLNETKIVDYYYAIPGFTRGSNMIGIVVFSLVFGAALSSMGSRGKPMVEFFENLSELSIKIVHLIMWFSPFGICSLICISILEMKNPTYLFKSLSFYILTFLAGSFIHGLILLPGLYFFLTRKNIFRLVKNVLEAMLVAFSTSSSSVTIPTTLKCIEDKQKVPKSISRLVIPFGAFVNKDGSVLFYVITCAFLTQLDGAEFSIIDLIMICFMAIMLSFGGAGGIPAGGLIIALVLLSLLNINSSKVSLVFAIDWFLDRCTTVLNVWGDCVVCAIIHELEKNKQTNSDENSDRAELIRQDRF